MAKHQCFNCMHDYPGWAIYMMPKGKAFNFPGRGKKIMPEKKMCGSCLRHAKDAGAISQQFYNRIAKNQMEEG